MRFWVSALGIETLISISLLPSSNELLKLPSATMSIVAVKLVVLVEQSAKSWVCESKFQPVGSVPTVASSTCTQFRLGLPSRFKEVIKLLTPFLKLTEFNAPFILLEAPKDSIFGLFCKSKSAIPVSLKVSASSFCKLETFNVVSWEF